MGYLQRCAYPCLPYFDMFFFVTRGLAWAVDSYSIGPPANGVSKKNNNSTKYLVHRCTRGPSWLPITLKVLQVHLACEMVVFIDRLFYYPSG